METCAVNIILKNFIIKDLQNVIIDLAGYHLLYFLPVLFFFMLPDCHENLLCELQTVMSWWHKHGMYEKISIMNFGPADPFEKILVVYNYECSLHLHKNIIKNLDYKYLITWKWSSNYYCFISFHRLTVIFKLQN